DGPSPSQALRKPPDNAIKTKSFPEGGGRISINATPEVYDQFKNFVLHMLKADKTPPDIPQDIRNLIHPTDRNEHDDRNAADQEDSVLPCEETKGESAGQRESSLDGRFPSVEEVADNSDDLRLDDAGLAVGEDAQRNTYAANNLQ